MDLPADQRMSDVLIEERADLLAAARLALACLDLTSLNDSDSEGDIAHLCRRANGQYGTTAAVCVWPRFAAQARLALPDNIAVAAVANFPDGHMDVQRAVADTRQIVNAGAQEVDLVLPYRSLMDGNTAAVNAVLDAVREACASLRLKVILESGCLATPELIVQASELSIAAGADFLKTSTGKVPVSATRDAAQSMLQCIARHQTVTPAAMRTVGFKVSGGIRTVRDAVLYMAMQRDWLGADAVSSARFRIGASGLLNDIEAILAGDGECRVVNAGSY